MHVHTHQVQQHSESFTICVAIFKIYAEDKSWTMKLDPSKLVTEMVS